MDEEAVEVVAVVRALEGRERQGVTLVVAADRSGSMGGDRIELLKSTLTFLIEEQMDEGDRLGIVAFHHESETLLDLTRMDAAGKRAARAAVARLSADGGTDFQDAIEKSVQMLVEHQVPTGDVLFLTDGQHEGSMSAEDLPAFAREQLFASANQLRLSTCGIGSGANETLLVELAREGLGSYGCIRDDVKVISDLIDVVSGARAIHAAKLSGLIIVHDGKLARPPATTFEVEQNDPDEEEYEIFFQSDVREYETRSTICEVVPTGPNCHLEFRLKYVPKENPDPSNVRTLKAEIPVSASQVASAGGKWVTMAHKLSIRLVDTLNDAFNKKKDLDGASNPAVETLEAMLKPTLKCLDALTALASDAMAGGRFDPVRQFFVTDAGEPFASVELEIQLVTGVVHILQQALQVARMSKDQWDAFGVKEAASLQVRAASQLVMNPDPSSHAAPVGSVDERFEVLLKYQ